MFGCDNCVLSHSNVDDVYYGIKQLISNESSEVWVSRKNNDDLVVLKGYLLNKTSDIVYYPNFEEQAINQELSCLEKLKNIEGIISLDTYFSFLSYKIISTFFIPGITMSNLALKLYNAKLKKYSSSLLEDIVIQLLNILKIIHSKNIIHFDVKPSNIILSGSGFNVKVTLTDFGISRNLSVPDCYQKRDAPGTIFYMSPEAQRGREFCDFRADIYSLGIIIKECLSFSYPECGTVKYTDVFTKNFVEKAVHTDVNKRFQSAEEMLQYLKYKKL